MWTEGVQTIYILRMHVEFEPGARPEHPEDEVAPAPVRVGVIGCGAVSRHYFSNLSRDPRVAVVGCADVDATSAAARAELFGIPSVASPEDLLADPDIELIVNLTPAGAHFAVTRDCLRAGKHVYTEKPLAGTFEEARSLVELAEARGRVLGCAPDTPFGTGFQASRKAVSAGALGRPLAAVACFTAPGPAGWHPSPDAFYRAGAGPLFDMGPYYLTDLIHLLGPISRVIGASRTPVHEVVAGERVIAVEVPTLHMGVLEFQAGALATLTVAWGVPGSDLPRITVFGSEGVLKAPDPNGFGGPATIKPHGADSWTELEGSRLPGDTRRNFRGAGVAEMALALREGRRPRADSRCGLHVVEAMEALLESGRSGRSIALTTACSAPPLLPPELRDQLLAP